MGVSVRVVQHHSRTPAQPDLSLEQWGRGRVSGLEILVLDSISIVPSR